MFLLFNSGITLFIMLNIFGHPSGVTPWMAKSVGPSALLQPQIPSPAILKLSPRCHWTFFHITWPFTPNYTPVLVSLICSAVTWPTPPTLSLVSTFPQQPCRYLTGPFLLIPCQIVKVATEYLICSVFGFFFWFFFYLCWIYMDFDLLQSPACPSKFVCLFGLFCWCWPLSASWFCKPIYCLCLSNCLYSTSQPALSAFGSYVYYPHEILNFLMDCHEIWYRYPWFPKEGS